MAYKDLIESVRVAQEALDGIIRTYERHFVHPLDRSFVDKLRREVDNYFVNAEAELQRHRAKGAQTPKHFELNKGEITLLEKIVAHADYASSHTDIKYNFFSEMVTPEQLLSTAQRLANNAYLGFRDKPDVIDVISNLKAGHRLSAQQVVGLEEVASKAKHMSAASDRGVIYFDPNRNPRIRDAARLIVLYGIGESRTKHLDAADVYRFRELYPDERSAADFYARFMESRQKLNTKPWMIAMYQKAWPVLMAYVRAVGPKTHMIDDNIGPLFRAVPRTSYAN